MRAIEVLVNNLHQIGVDCKIQDSEFDCDYALLDLLLKVQSYLHVLNDAQKLEVLEQLSILYQKRKVQDAIPDQYIIISALMDSIVEKISDQFLLGVFNQFPSN